MNTLSSGVAKTDAPVLSIEDIQDLIILCERELALNDFMRRVVPGIRTCENINGVTALEIKLEKILKKRIELENMKAKA